MRDKPHSGAIDHTRDHHFINGQLVPVVERAPNRTQKARSIKRQKTAAGRADARTATKPDA